MCPLRLFRRLKQTPAAEPALAEPALPPPLPDEPVCLVGDVHGRADLLERLLKLRAHHFADHRLVVLGDVVDRGPGTAAVLEMLRRETELGAICLMGNHEEMMLAFLDEPEGEDGRRWLAHGGLEALASYDLLGLPQKPEERRLARDALRGVMGAGTEQWLRDLPRMWQSGDLVAVHAAMDPALPPAMQDPRDLIWGHPAFDSRTRDDGLWVAHGHVIVDRAHVRGGRIALDTGAYATGQLSYALVNPAAAESERITLAVVPQG